MSRSVRIPPPPPPRPAGDLDEFVAWCTATQDVLAFQNALRAVAEEQWPTMFYRLAGALVRGTAEGSSRNGAGGAAEREARGRAAARRHKLELLARHAPPPAVREASPQNAAV